MAWDDQRQRGDRGGLESMTPPPPHGILIQDFNEQSGHTEHVRRQGLACRPPLLNLACFPNAFDHKAASCGPGIAHGLA